MTKQKGRNREEGQPDVTGREELSSRTAREVGWAVHPKSWGAGAVTTLQALVTLASGFISLSFLPLTIQENISSAHLVVEIVMEIKC